MTTPTKRNLFWHFAPADGRLSNGDGRGIAVGKTLTVTPPLCLCKHGLHASYRAIDALYYAAGPIVCRVRLGGDFCAGTDKVVASERTVLAKADASKVLHEFACWCAERALRAASVTDERCWRAVEVKRSWLAGETTDQDLASAWEAARAASEAARAAAWAARSAARSAAWASAWAASAATSAATSEAARAAARAAAWAASEAASAAERVAQNRRLEAVLKKLLAEQCN